jgi:putative transposase
MPEIIAILEVLSPSLSTKTLKHLALMVESMLSMTGRVTMLSISRWTEKGGSYRTVQRFFKEEHQWAKLRWLLIKNHLSEICLGTWIIIGDEVVITKSGKKTHGLARFFSSIQNQAVPGLCFIEISLLHVESRQSYPLVAEQLIKKKAQNTAPKADKEKGKPGRPKGSKNKNRTEVELSAFQLQLQNCIRQALGLIGGTLKTGHFVYDGALGNNAGLQTVKQLKLHLVSKLRHDSMLYFPFAGKYSGKGKPKKYGEKLTLETLPETNLRETTVKKTSKPSIIRFRCGTRISPAYSMSWSLLKRTLKRARSQRFCYSAMT